MAQFSDAESLINGIMIQSRAHLLYADTEQFIIYYFEMEIILDVCSFEVILDSRATLLLDYVEISMVE